MVRCVPAFAWRIENDRIEETQLSWNTENPVDCADFGCARHWRSESGNRPGCAGICGPERAKGKEHGGRRTRGQTTTAPDGPRPERQGLQTRVHALHGSGI